jgi:hypothetical protein
MLLGIYRISFQSSLATVGEGVAVFDSCGVHGANENHVFRGMQVGYGEALRLTVEIVHLHGEKYPTFGKLSAINVDVEVTETTDEGFRAQGSIREARGIKLNILGRKLADLVEPADEE